MIWRDTGLPATGEIDPEQELELRLVAHARAGAAWALSSLVARYQPPVVRYLARLLGDRERAYALAEQVFVRMGRRLRGPHGGHHLRLWLLRTATDAGLDMLRNPQRNRLPRLSAPDGPAALLPEPDADKSVKQLFTTLGARLRKSPMSLPVPRTQEFVWDAPESVTIGSPLGSEESGATTEQLSPRELVRHRLIRAVLAELPYGDAQCLALHLVAGLNQSEVAQALGVTAPVARRRIVQGLQLFGRRYEATLASLGLPSDFAATPEPAVELTPSLPPVGQVVAEDRPLQIDAIEAGPAYELVPEPEAVPAMAAEVEQVLSDTDEVTSLADAAEATSLADAAEATSLADAAEVMPAADAAEGVPVADTGEGEPAMTGSVPLAEHQWGLAEDPRADVTMEDEATVAAPEAPIAVEPAVESAIDIATLVYTEETDILLEDQPDIVTHASGRSASDDTTAVDIGFASDASEPDRQAAAFVVSRKPTHTDASAGDSTLDRDNAPARAPDVAPAAADTPTTEPQPGASPRVVPIFAVSRAPADTSEEPKAVSPSPNAPPAPEPDAPSPDVADADDDLVVWDTNPSIPIHVRAGLSAVLNDASEADTSGAEADDELLLFLDAERVESKTPALESRHERTLSSDGEAEDPEDDGWHGASDAER
jgi:RNA polymerase sigma factor (sigma-70 family)